MEHNSFDRRVLAIDLVRGLVMVLMALDHTRDYFSSANFDPLDLQRTDATLFFTRWITHFCAPLFIFLSGASSYLSLTRNGDARGQSRLLLSRGALLILLDLTVIRWTGWNFSLDMVRIRVGVLWAIGWSMIVLAGLIRLRLQLIAAIGLTLMLGHNLLDPLRPEDFGAWGWLWQVIHAGGGFEFGNGRRFIASYPLVPWIGVMAAGFAFGPMFRLEPARRRLVLLHWGMALTAGFVLLRLGNLYGDAERWSAQASDLQTLMSLLKCTKYPPSLHYLLMTLGPGMILLAALEQSPPSWLRPLNVFGQVPLFFYLLHLPLIHALAALMDYGRYGHAEWQFGWPLIDPRPQQPPDQGFGLLIVYLAAACVALCLYLPCRWFAGLKRTSRSIWVRLL